MTKRIYVASSWRNEHQPQVVQYLRNNTHKVYDFRNPPYGPGGFSWDELDPNWENWDTKTYREKLLNSPRAAQGFMQDIRGMFWCDTCILVLPSGNSAHAEMGWCAGAGKHTITFLPEKETKPDLMYLIAGDIVTNYTELQEALN